RIGLFAAVELHAPEDSREGLECRTGAPRVEEYAAGHPRCEYQPASAAVPGYWRSAADASAEPVRRTDSGIVVVGRGNHRPAAALAALPAVHECSFVPGQRGKFQLPRTCRQARKAHLPRVDGKRLLYVL